MFEPGELWNWLIGAQFSPFLACLSGHKLLTTVEFSSTYQINSRATI